MVHAGFTSAVHGAFTIGRLGVSGVARVGKERGDANGATEPIAPASVARAIASAEKQVGGEAVGTGSEDSDGESFYIEVLSCGAERRVILDLLSGRIVGDDVTSAGPTRCAPVFARCAAAAWGGSVGGCRSAVVGSPQRRPRPAPKGRP